MPSVVYLISGLRESSEYLAVPLALRIATFGFCFLLVDPFHSPPRDANLKCGPLPPSVVYALSLRELEQVNSGLAL